MSVRFYHREQCHLCEEALALLQQAGLGEYVVMIDIDSDPELGVAYGLRIPVVESSTGRALDWPFDLDAVRALLL
jgi:hypothetical protein